jgi:RNA polymerase sigma factor (sigma-70 family)
VKLLKLVVLRFEKNELVNLVLHLSGKNQSMRTQNSSEEQQRNLLDKALEGDKKALNNLIAFYEPFIYNVAWKYTNNPEEAKDLTQEVFIKVITNLSSFNGKSAFKTWVYRIVVNQFLQTKRRSMEDRWESFDAFSNELNSIPSPELSVEEEIEQTFRTKTARTRCMSAMLMCLTREQRLIYLLGDVFNLDHNLGAEVFGISKQNYRVKLSRTRKDFHAFMNQQCGLVNEDNPCRCSKKAKALEAAGKMQTDKKLFDPAFSATIATYAEGVADEVSDLVDKKYIEFFQAHPTKADFDADTVIAEIINDENLHHYFK